jgi:predicted ATPase
MLRRAQATRAGLPGLIAHRLVGTSALVVGRLSEAEGHLLAAEDLWTDAINKAAGLLYGQDVRVGIDAYLSLTLWYLGCPDQALRRAHEAESRARRLLHANTLGYALFHAGWLYGLTSRHAALEAHGRALIEIGDRHGHELWGAGGRLLLAWKRIVEAPDREAVAQFEENLVDYRSTQMGLNVPLFVSVLAVGYGKAGAPERGLGVIDEALTLVEERGERLNEAELHRTGGEIEQGRGDTQTAETRFKKAIAIARGQQNRSFELRAAASLARLWCAEGQTAQARDLLGSVYGSFTEGFETADVAAARALLGALR